ncbi:hypothetical protein BDV24DRAFT_148475 [Aspergillus arachidicola]|uniref:Short-chain oxidoreductase n=1 Tax=Aspergillus arachidicola TaxID=656916 RepID=A0A5N6YHY4_9EURO|nr:hypothetical protein BDV24DRAFT_148475 [Aspergillus arachidicola]
MTGVQAEISPKVWCVTGCSSGFGREFISAITARGDKVIATARDINTLTEYTNHDNIRLMQLDVTAPKEVLKEVVDKAISIFGHVDILINNAGYVLSGVWEESSQSQVVSQFQTNVFGPLELTSVFLPHMRSRGRGTVIFMSSVAGWLGVAVGGPYSASKFALEGAAESLQKEVQQFGVNVHLAVLGQFRTNILNPERRKTGRPAQSIRQYDDMINAFQSRLERTDGAQIGDPSQAVQRILDAVYRTGYFAGNRTIPLRIVLGSDAMDIVRAKCQAMLDDLKEQENVGKSTDFKDSELVQPYN